MTAPLSTAVTWLSPAVSETWETLRRRSRLAGSPELRDLVSHL